ncbi:2-C-methyl-D-erythritol 4-phosphate cytidylyltransferase [Aestuariicella hydrocarbonica]|uniref:2-C-methyl-D-erythritol 4-phosphate cytidylyltransferase n=1 Tax=Pseudomaricurvus hydrocarbonicus TaxID=1470433 RepID=A0A9E5JP36_9GAMM|nr:2-C-methyl-D-erythritol 4-phosphate cytidylyltransferase [Aestuariicella hydrocarbonica]NHO63987.1 2-C-methyl-D-erythritol 4-phosphate cytidylyltransferase [Aestuariicella hydrocarbonica]
MSHFQSSEGYWVIVPAAGVGSRMGADKPKQYLTLNHKTILEHTLERLLQLPALNGIVVVVHPLDAYWSELPIFENPKIKVIEGGQERCDSVLNGLDTLDEHLQPLDWVMVHDAARPCFELSDVEELIEKLDEHLVGGILGVPVSDTVKRLNDNYGIEETVDRRVLWLAQTPQMFRYGVLAKSLREALQQGIPITDEASALEAAGYVPLMVEGRRDNIKVTRPEDIPMAELILRLQER